MSSLATAGWSFQFAFAMQIIGMVLAIPILIFTTVSLVRLFRLKASLSGPTINGDDKPASETLHQRRSLIANNLLVFVSSVFSLVRSAIYIAIILFELRELRPFPYSYDNWETILKLDYALAWFTYATLFLFFTSLLAVEQTFYEPQGPMSNRKWTKFGYSFLVLVLLALGLASFGVAVNQYGLSFAHPSYWTFATNQEI
jgi:hypothetical protein